MAASSETAIHRAPLAGLLAWIFPGLGHFYLGDRRRGIILMVTITLTFWTGVAVGGAGATIDPQARKLWFMAQVLNGGNAFAGYGLHILVVQQASREGVFGATTAIPRDVAPYLSNWMGADVGVHYTGIAGLLNLLVILDAISRADPSRRIAAATAGGAGGP